MSFTSSKFIIHVALPGFFWCSQENRHLSQWRLGDLFPNFEKNPNRKIFIQSSHTPVTLHGDNLLPLHLISLQLYDNIVCVIANLFYFYCNR